MAIQNPRLTRQEGNLLSATATYRDAENVWHDLAIAFLPHEDGSRRLTVQDDNQDETLTPEKKAAIKHLSEIVRSAIPVHREHVAAATELGEDPDEASRIIIRNLIDHASGYMGYGVSAAWKNHRMDPEKYPAPQGLLRRNPS